MLQYIRILFEGVINMHVGSKGWYVEQLKHVGVRRLEGRKIEKYKKPVLANLLAEKQD